MSDDTVANRDIDTPAHRAAPDSAPHARAEASQGTIGRNSLRILISQSAGNAGWFAAVLVLARSLGPTGRGTVAFITVTASVASIFAGLGVNEATRVRAARSPELRPALLANATLVALVGGATAGLCVAALMSLVSALRPGGIGGPELIILVLATTVSACELAAFTFLQACGRFRAFSRVQATGPWLYAIALAIVQVTVGLTAASAAAIWTTEVALVSVVVLSAGAAGAGFSRPDFRVLRQSVGFGARAWIGSTSRILNARTDQIITGVLATEATLGIYSVAVNVSEILYYLPTAAALVLIPTVAGGDPAMRVERAARVYRGVLLVTLAGCALAAAVGPLLLPVVFGHAYRPSVVPFLILVPSGIGFATMSVFSGASLGSLAPGRSSLGPLAALISQTTLDLLLIPGLGATGAAIAATSALLLGGAVAVFSYRTRFPFAWRLLLPRRRDISMIVQLATATLRQLTGSGGEPQQAGASAGEEGAIVR